MRRLRFLFGCFAFLLCCAFFGGFDGKNDENRHKTAQNCATEYSCGVEIRPLMATLGTLSTPQNLNFQDNGIATFDAVENAESYNVRLYSQAGDKICDVPSSSNSVDLSDYMLQSAGTYYFTVMAFDADGDYDNSPYSIASNTVSTVNLTINYSLSVDETYPISAVALIGKKYVECLSTINVEVDKYDYTWCFDDGGKAGDEIGESVVANDKLSVFAKYSGKPYTVKFVTNGGTNIADKTCYYDAENVTPIGTCGTEKQGYSFVGWCFNQDLSDSPFWSIPKDTFGNIKLYAKWKIKGFSISVDINSNCDKEYDGLGVSFDVSMDAPASPYINYTYVWYKDAIKDENVQSSSTVETSFSTGAGVEWSGDYFVKVIAKNPYEISDVYSVQSGQISVSIRKCTPYVTSFGTPTADGIFGNNLSSITLQGVTANAVGNVVFDNPDAVLEVGKHSYSVTFVPDDADNYNEVKGIVEINTVIPKEKRTLEIEFTVPDKMVENGNEYTVTAIAANLEGDDDVKLLLSNNVQSRAGKYIATVVGMQVIKAEFFDYQLPSDGLSCDFEILSAQIRTSDKLLSDIEGTFVDDDGVPYDATIKISSADFDVSGLDIGDNQKIIGKYTIDVLSGENSLSRNGKVSMKLGDKDVDLENAELYVKTDSGFEKVDFNTENGTITFNAKTPVSVVLVGKIAPDEAPQKSYVWLIILLTCVVLIMAFVVIFLAIRVSKSLQKEGKAKRNAVVETEENSADEKAEETEQIKSENVGENLDENNVENADENYAENLPETDDEIVNGNGKEIVNENNDISATDESVKEKENAVEDKENGKEIPTEKTAVDDTNLVDVDRAEIIGVTANAKTEEIVEIKKRKTFDDKLKEQNEEFIEYYNTLKDCIMQYDGIKSRSSSSGETFKYKRAVAKLTIDEKTLRLHLALDPNDEKYNDGTCPHKDMSAYESYRDLPFMFKIKSGLALRRALKLIEDAMTIAGAKKPQ